MLARVLPSGSQPSERSENARQSRTPDFNVCQYNSMLLRFVLARHMRNVVGIRDIHDDWTKHFSGELIRITAPPPFLSLIITDLHLAALLLPQRTASRRASNFQVQ